jgi:hypothetical protein
MNNMDAPKEDEVPEIRKVSRSDSAEAVNKGLSRNKTTLKISPAQRKAILKKSAALRSEKV